MRHEITDGPAFAMLRVDLDPGETVTAEAGAMVGRNDGVAMEVKLNASRGAGFLDLLIGLFVAFIRKAVGGETFFVNAFTAQGRPGSVWLSPAWSGAVHHRALRGESLTLSSGAYLASSGDLSVKVKWGGLRSLLAKEGLFMLEISGNGDLWFNSYGAIHEIEVRGSHVVDNGHLVGFEGGLTFDIKSVGGGVMGFVASGEGLVCEFRGNGKVYVQSRNVSSLVSWISPFLPG